MGNQGQLGGQVLMAPKENVAKEDPPAQQGRLARLDVQGPEVLEVIRVNVEALDLLVRMPLPFELTCDNFDFAQNMHL